MGTKKKTVQPSEIPAPRIQPNKKLVTDPEEPVLTDTDPEIIPDEDPYENPPSFEKPDPGEGP